VAIAFICLKAKPIEEKYLIRRVAELIVKFLILVGILPVIGRGIGNISALGWFNLAALVFGVLFTLEGLHHHRQATFHEFDHHGHQFNNDLI
jgi:TRAP-type mannitol/chloroaromatic compound transport system permease small subunit